MLEERLEVFAGCAVLAKRVSRGTGMIECHVMVRPELDHEFHDGAGGQIVAHVCDRMADIEHDAYGRPSLPVVHLRELRLAPR